MVLRIVLAAAAAAALSVVPASAVTCKVDGFTITARKHVGCGEAKKVTHRQVSEKSLPKGWKCTNTGTLIPKGTCTKKAEKRSFHYEM